MKNVSFKDSRPKKSKIPLLYYIKKFKTSYKKANKN